MKLSLFVLNVGKCVLPFYVLFCFPVLFCFVKIVGLHFVDAGSVYDVDCIFGNLNKIFFLNKNIEGKECVNRCVSVY